MNVSSFHFENLAPSNEVYELKHSGSISTEKNPLKLFLRLLYLSWGREKSHTKNFFESEI